MILIECLEGVEELLLCALFTADKLNVVDKKYVVISVFLSEVSHGYAVERLDQFVCKVLAFYVTDLRRWVFPSPEFP